ncbi:MAG: glycosyltransferase [Thermoproteaceae archaeon]|nr:glycosyltransferase [Thermoproteaceae archaeon]
MDPLTALGAALAAAHFGAPLAYYAAAKRWLKMPWRIRPDPAHTPTVTVAIPTYNEAGHIEEKLEDIYRQDYPRDRLEVIVVDSASRDGTAEKARRWAEAHPDVDVKVVEEPERRGKAAALNAALAMARGEVFVITDADCRWPQRDALRRAVSWLADPAVGAVTCLKRPAADGPAGVEAGYRDRYNVLRLAESKKWATPVFHGELAAYRTELLRKIGGFPLDIGADDSHTATLIALTGYRAVAAEGLWCVEAVPHNGYHRWRIRRAQHLIQHFLRAPLRRAPPPMRPILLAEKYLHLANPWLLPAAAVALAATATPPALALLAAGAAALALKPYRTWAAAQLYLMVAAVKNLRNRELVWEKQEK